MTFKRYAIFYTPAPGPFAAFGASWLGWDAQKAQRVSPPEINDLPLNWDDITAPARRYGFHATIKPPFQLAHGHHLADLETALAGFCETQYNVGLAGLELAQLGRFLALVPQGDQADLNALAAATVRTFDRFRAPMSETELTRRRSPTLTPTQDALLCRWGYPYVMEAFRFHITLSGKMPKAKATELRKVLAPIFDPHLTYPFEIKSLSLMGEDSDGMFHLINRYDLCPLP